MVIMGGSGVMRKKTSKPTDPMDCVGLEDAVVFAAEMHRGQLRKDTAKTPYIIHPISVAAVLASEGGVEDEALLMAAVLHDTVEDTGVKVVELERRFGTEVAELVAEVSDDKSLPKAERKRLQVEHAPHASAGARQLKIADKTCNLRDLVAHPPQDWPDERKLNYVRWASQVVAGCRGLNCKLEEAFDRAADEARRALGGGSES